MGINQTWSIIADHDKHYSVKCFPFAISVINNDKIQSKMGEQDSVKLEKNFSFQEKLIKYHLKLYTDGADKF